MLIRAATRGSPLALWQTHHVAALLRAVDPSIEVEPVVVTTTADRRQDVPIAEMGGKGVFVKEVQAAVLDGRADIAVHSAKDLPSATHPDLVISAIPERGDPRDALVGCTLADLRPESHVATGSQRRQAQLAHLRPGMRFSHLRGSIATRLDKAAGFDAIVVANAALDRLGIPERASEVLDVDVMIPQVGQGALAVESRLDAVDVSDVLASIDHGPSRRVLEAERAFLAELGGDCDLPAGAHATVSDDVVRVDAMIGSIDGMVLLRERVEARDGVAAARSAARRLLDDRGGAGLLDDR
ncbi:hydroxymethylbilane synthase [Actinomarinicola tropica]|uniref:hydroxymethylbilane synthase n=1 Tax=Actinomarinicola tropica TaxID=2789776 RepID=UPI001896E8C8|nr:hydroxymethylbilane synthase [Actinomarinicola tropica]